MLEAGDVIDSFTGQYEFLSNFYYSPIKVHKVGRGKTVEHVYQAMKCQDKDQAAYVLSLPTPGQAKRAGRKVILREDWEMVKVHAMYKCLRAKFPGPGDELSERLLATDWINLIEGNTWGDQVWGVCGGQGANLLGKILMHRRAELVVMTSMLDAACPSNMSRNWEPLW